MWLLNKQYNVTDHLLRRGVDDYFDMFSNNALDITKSTVPLRYSDADDYFEFSFALPGIAKENISVDYNEGYLTVDILDSIEKKTANYDEFKSHYQKRSVYVGEVMFDQANASFDNGILYVKLPKKPESKSQSLVIN